MTHTVGGFKGLLGRLWYFDAVTQLRFAGQILMEGNGTCTWSPGSGEKS